MTRPQRPRPDLTSPMGRFMLRWLCRCAGALLVGAVLGVWWVECKGSPSLADWGVLLLAVGMVGGAWVMHWRTRHLS